MYSSGYPLQFEPSALNVSSGLQPEGIRQDARAEMAARLPHLVQPFLTWLTAKPAPGEAAVETSPLGYVREALALTLGGCAASVAAMAWLQPEQALFWVVLLAGLTATTSGLGVFQVVIFHHCAHRTVFSKRDLNRKVGRWISAILLFKHFDAYQKEHMVHHSANKLFTDDDEFTDFVVGICRLGTARRRRDLWLQLLTDLASPVFHTRFMMKRVRGAFGSYEASHNILGMSVWFGLLAGAVLAHAFVILLVAVVLPISVLLQIATVFRILCEHRVPPVEVIERRGQELVCQATAGVFPGLKPPAKRHHILAWAAWWGNMLTIQLFVRIVVLVGDAPCHDFHHRRPAGKRWTDYAHSRQADLDAGCPGFPLNYFDSWGLFSAIDQNFAAMERAPAGLLG